MLIVRDVKFVRCDRPCRHHAQFSECYEPEESLVLHTKCTIVQHVHVSQQCIESWVSVVYPKIIISTLQDVQRQRVEASVLRAKKTEVVVQYL